MKERSRQDLRARPRKAKEKKPKKPHRYKHEGSGPGRKQKYYCPDHNREHVLTPKQIAGEKPIKCRGHEITVDFRKIDIIMDVY